MMINKKILVTIFATLIGGVFAFSMLFSLNQIEQAVIFQFGNPVKIVKNAGLNVKLPFIQNVVFFDTRLQEISATDKEVIASDQKRLIISAFVKYKITDPVLFYTTVKDTNGFKNKFSTILDSSLRQVIGAVPLNTLLSNKRAGLMEKIQDVVDTKANQFGVSIIDVRITKSDLPRANSNAIYKRMQTDREREAREIRAVGDEMAQKIRANTDKEKIFMISEARKKAEIIMGDGDATASKVYSKSYSKDADFFDFYRSMQSYKSAFANKNTKIIISPNSEYLKNMNNYKRTSGDF